MYVWIFINYTYGFRKMDKKLTLKLNKDVIERAKQLAAERKVSLSKLVENYLASITGSKKDEMEISAFVKSISSGIGIPADITDEKAREDYLEYLDKKYQ